MNMYLCTYNQVKFSGFMLLSFFPVKVFYGLIFYEKFPFLDSPVKIKQMFTASRSITPVCTYACTPMQTLKITNWHMYQP